MEEMVMLSWDEQIKYKSAHQLLEMREWQVEFIATHPLHSQTKHRIELINKIDCELYYREKPIAK